MKMINVIKKGTVLALATLGLCLSVSASAEPQWTRVSGIFTSTGIETHNGDSFCENVNWVSHTHYLGPWRWNSYNATSIDCWTSYNYGKQEMWATQTAYCKEGGQIDQENFGCYELREVEPPEFPPNHPLCEGRARDRAVGNVACEVVQNRIISETCFWQDKLRPSLTNARARQVAYICSREHEMSHKNDTNLLCNGGVLGPPSLSYTHVTERNAFEAEIACYQREKEACRADPVCMSEMDFTQVNKSELIADLERGFHIRRIPQ